MYNRYVPQSDGTYRRNRMEEPKSQQSPQQPRKTQPEPLCPPEPSKCDPPELPRREQRCHQSQPLGGFLRQLLPSNFDTADLIIVLLLLLLAGDCEEDRTTAMLTLVLYLFM